MGSELIWRDRTLLGQYRIMRNDMDREANSNEIKLCVVNENAANVDEMSLKRDVGIRTNSSVPAFTASTSDKCRFFETTYLTNFLQRSTNMYLAIRAQ